MTDEISGFLVNERVTPSPSERFEQYKLYVETADKISGRRLAANSFYLTINTALAAFLGYVTSKDSLETTLAVFGIPVAGMVLCYVWYRQICSYRDLNKAKFDVIHVMEEHMSFKMFEAEWELLGRGSDKKKYRSFSDTEKLVPWVFFGIHVVLILAALCGI